jgi:HEPN domain-containing protein
MTILDIAHEWLTFANNDLISARHLFENIYPKQTNIAAYLCQQCAEKALKAFLVAYDIDPPKVHNLERLVCLCQDIDADFSRLEIDCKKINPYGTASRYPGELPVDDAIAKTLIERAQKIYDFCTARLPIQGGTP